MVRPACGRLPYTDYVTAKQALRDLVDTLSEDDAEELLQRLAWETQPEEHLTDEEAQDLVEAIAEGERGETVGGTEVFRALGL